MEYVLAIDPGQKESGFVKLKYNKRNKNFKIIEKGILENNKILKKIYFFKLIINPTEKRFITIESITSYGMPIGQSTIDSIYWVGRFHQKAIENDIKTILIPRKDIKLYLCGNCRAKDKNIRQRLIDKFGLPGTKKNPGKLCGISNHTWAALATGVVFLEQKYNCEIN